MCDSTTTQTAPFGTGSLDKWAQLRHTGPERVRSAFPKSEKSRRVRASTARDRLRKRARAKAMGLPLVKRLAALESPLHNSYHNSLLCANYIEQCNDELTTHYCKTRWCLVCARIRMGKAIRDYLPVIEGWNEPHLVTLTVPNVPGPALAQRLDRMVRKEFRNAKKAIQRRGIPFKGIRKIECTYNAGRVDFHPHFHVLVEGAAAAVALADEWYKRVDGANRRAQDVRPCDEDALKEIFKYCTKLISNDRRVSAENLDVIFRAMKKRRVFQSFGFTLPKGETLEEEFQLNKTTKAYTQLGQNVLFQWQQSLTDWVDRETGECLTGYSPSERDRAYMQATDQGTTLSDDTEPLEGHESDVVMVSETVRNRKVSEPGKDLSKPALVLKNVESEVLLNVKVEPPGEVLVNVGVEPGDYLVKPNISEPGMLENVRVKPPGDYIIKPHFYPPGDLSEIARIYPLVPSILLP